MSNELSTNAEAVLKQALALSQDERVQVADHLYGSISLEEEQEIEKAWIEEAQRRYADYKAGNVELISADVVIERLRKKLF